MRGGAVWTSALVVAVLMVSSSPFSPDSHLTWNEAHNLEVEFPQPVVYEISNGSYDDVVSLIVTHKGGGPVMFVIVVVGTEMGSDMYELSGGDDRRLDFFLKGPQPHQLIISATTDVTAYVDIEFSDPYDEPSFWHFWMWQEMCQIGLCFVSVIILVVVIIGLYIRAGNKRKALAALKEQKMERDAWRRDVTRRDRQWRMQEDRRRMMGAGYGGFGPPGYAHHGGYPPPRQYPHQHPYAHQRDLASEHPHPGWQIPPDQPYSHRREHPPPGSYPPGPVVPAGAGASQRGSQLPQGEGVTRSRTHVPRPAGAPQPQPQTPQSAAPQPEAQTPRPAGAPQPKPQATQPAGAPEPHPRISQDVSASRPQTEPPRPAGAPEPLPHLPQDAGAPAGGPEPSLGTLPGQPPPDSPHKRDGPIVGRIARP